jgi:hypothetical protein
LYDQGRGFPRNVELENWVYGIEAYSFHGAKLNMNIPFHAPEEINRCNFLKFWLETKNDGQFQKLRS